MNGRDYIIRSDDRVVTGYSNVFFCIYATFPLMIVSVLWYVSSVKHGAALALVAILYMFFVLVEIVITASHRWGRRYRYREER